MAVLGTKDIASTTPTGQARRGSLPAAGDGTWDYAPLGRFLAARAARGATTITLGFARVEHLLGRPLPPSARRHRQWWANDRTHSQAAAWLDAGWRTGQVDVAGEWVTFSTTRREDAMR